MTTNTSKKNVIELHNQAQAHVLEMILACDLSSGTGHIKVLSEAYNSLAEHKPRKPTSTHGF